MKKLLSLSLVASATILSLNAGAQDLSEAIKDVDISGTIAYRYNDYEGQPNVGKTASNNYKMAVNLKSKVNDDVTANTRFVAGDGNGNVELNTSTQADANVNVVLSEVNFTYTGLSNAAITVGKQGIASPFTVNRDAMGPESTGTGITANYTLDPVTLVASYFNQTNITALQESGNGTQDLLLAGIMGSFGPVNAEAWYLDIADKTDAYTVAADASFELGAVTLEPAIRYTEQGFEVETSSNDERSTFKLSLGATMGMFDAFLAYGESGKDGGVDIDDNASDTAFDEHWRIALKTEADSEIFYANVGAQITDELHVALKYSDLDGKPASVTDKDEIYTQITYKMSSNLTTYVRLGELDVEGKEKENMGRLHVQYSF